jgi:hypothetical protein
VTLASQEAETRLTRKGWRRMKADEYPDDSRNLEAAAELERLAQSADQVPPALAKAYTGLAGGDANSQCALTELESEKLRRVGFNDGYASAADFVESMISEWNRREGWRRRADMPLH